MYNMHTYMYVKNCEKNVQNNFYAHIRDAEKSVTY